MNIVIMHDYFLSYGAPCKAPKMGGLVIGGADYMFTISSDDKKLYDKKFGSGNRLEYCDNGV